MATNFQRESAAAIVRHFRDHAFALCADDPGMGKTYIANEVIRQMALEKMNSAGEKTDFTVLARELGQHKRREYLAGRLQELGSQLGIVVGNHQDRKPWEPYFLTALEQFAAVPGCIESSQFWEGLSTIMRGDHPDNHRHMSSWRISWPQAPRLKVLYICCNLAIAEQNKVRISPVPQIDQEGDRLSMLWESERDFPTPFVDLYAITATLSKRDTTGTQAERACLARFCKKVCSSHKCGGAKLSIEAQIFLDNDLRSCARSKAEAYSLAKFHPDLVIFDEFQNFGDMINLITDPAAPDQAPMRKTAEEQREQEERLHRLRAICRHLYHNGDQVRPKTLLLSATPFHPENPAREDFLRYIAFDDLLQFLALDNPDVPAPDVWEGMAAADRERYLYTHGVFRNRRKDLISWEGVPYKPASTRIMECPVGDLLYTARLWKTDDDNETRDISPAILMDTPLPEKYAAQHYRGEPKLVPQRSVMGHGKYRAVRYLAMGGRVKATTYPQLQPDCDWQKETVQARPPVWIPPIQAGIPEPEGRYSKLLVYTDYQGTREALADLLCREIPTGNPGAIENEKQWKDLLLSPARWREEGLLETQAPTVCLLRHFFPEDYQALCGQQGTLEMRQEIQPAMERFLNFLLRCGLPAGEREMLEYCQKWCLDQTLAEYAAICDARTTPAVSAWQQLDQVLSYGADRGGMSFAMELTPVELLESDDGPTLRKAFNSPFWPHVLVSTSIGAEGLDFHLYCRRVLHYALPTDCIGLEQRNGRVNRRDCLATRMAWAAQQAGTPNWKAFLQAEPTADSSGILPHWYARGEDLEEIFLCYPSAVSRDWGEIRDLLEQQKNYQSHLDYELSPFLKKYSGQGKCHMGTDSAVDER